ncbi:MAG: hypothetical protein H7Y62_14925 [Hyphomicrobium sp.]|nr:hypothetical protein [Hyphomicrobium sp.]
MPAAIECDVGLVVLEQVEVRQVVAGAIEQRLIQRPVVRTYGLDVASTNLILEPGRCRR